MWDHIHPRCGLTSGEAQGHLLNTSEADRLAGGAMRAKPPTPLPYRHQRMVLPAQIDPAASSAAASGQPGAL
jgi:hypothetical protein